MAFTIPGRLAVACRNTPERAAWLARLPDTLRDLEQRWSLTIGVPFDGDGMSGAWVAPVALGTGPSAVLKLGIPHMESEYEIEGLRFWNGDPTVRLLEADDDLGAMLLERCEPGTMLRMLPEPEQDLHRAAPTPSMAPACRAVSLPPSVGDACALERRDAGSGQRLAR